MRCNALCPGFVDTAFNTGFEADGGRRALEGYVRSTVPMDAGSTAEEIAHAIVTWPRTSPPS